MIKFKLLAIALLSLSLSLFSAGLSADTISQSSEPNLSVESLTIIPAPNSVSPLPGAFKLPSKWRVKLKGVGKDFIDLALRSSKIDFKCVKAHKTDLVVEVDKSLKLHPEAYILEIHQSGIKAVAASEAGLFYALQSLSQIVDQYEQAGRADGPNPKSLKEQGVVKLPCLRIEDEPKYDYRGIMIDVSRHFRSIPFLKKQIDQMAYYKLNRLHLHLTDAAGWRVEIKSYPKLTEFAAWRSHENWKEWWFGDRHYRQMGDERGAFGGFYTQHELKELVDYAQRRNITIIPEIEMPAHSEEVLTAYPELSCTHEPYKQADFCPGNEAVYDFLFNVLDEIVDIFPSKHIHIGGDEAGMASWGKCKLCQELMAKEGMTELHQLQDYLINRVSLYLASKGRRAMAWDEAVHGGLQNGDVVMSWRGEQGGIKAIEKGLDVVMSPGEFCYLDAYQDAPPTQPEAIGGFLPLRKVYGYSPFEPSTSSNAKVIGIQGNVWTEYIPTEDHLEYMLYPRALAIAEVAWTRAENKDWGRFHANVIAHTDRLQELDYHPFDIRLEHGNRPGYSDVPLEHLAYGKKVSYLEPWWRSYPCNAEQTLTDGLLGGWSYNDARWQGFVGRKRMDVVIDLEEVTPITQIYADFMQVCGPDVFMPEKVIISISDDGDSFTEIKRIDNEVVRDDKVSFKRFGWEGEAKARYVRYQALASDKHQGVQFVDEVVVK